jgi:L-threonylcarbamoyladenylate synthase
MAFEFDCTVDDRRQRGLRSAISALRRGEVVFLPVDTMYVLAVDPFSAKGVAALRAVKGRGRDLPLSVCVAGVRTVEGLMHPISYDARNLMEAFWPGPLTLVGMAQPSLAWDIGDTRGTVGVRMPLHPLALHLLREFGPLAVTSAARAGYPAPCSGAQARELLGDEVSIYLDAGEVLPSTPSTVIDVTSTPPRLLRSGGYPDSELVAICPELVLEDGPASA